MTIENEPSDFIQIWGIRIIASMHLIRSLAYTPFILNFLYLQVFSPGSTDPNLILLISLIFLIELSFGVTILLRNAVMVCLATAEAFLLFVSSIRFAFPPLLFTYPFMYALPFIQFHTSFIELIFILILGLRWINRKRDLSQDEIIHSTH